MGNYTPQMLSPRQFRANPLGAQIDAWTDSMIYHAIDTARSMIESAVGEQFNYHVVQETFRLDPKNMTWTPRETPLRAMLSMNAVGFVHAGKAAYFNIDTEYIVPSDGTLPLFFGPMELDRNQNVMRFDTFDLAAYLPGLAYLAASQFIVTYSAGYDSGVGSQPDGITLPAPDWLQLALRQTTKAVIDAWNTSALIPGTLKSYVVGGWRAVASPNGSTPVIPDSVMADLAYRFSTWEIA